MTAVSIENLSKTYPPSFPRLKKFLHLEIKPPVEALKNVSLEIKQGEIFGLIGRNGAGKTTLTKIIATLVQPTAGKVLVQGYDSVIDEVKVRSLVGLATAEERSFYWRLTAEQNLMFFARLYGMKDSEARKRISELFERLSLNELSELSTGNKQRLAIARAILPAPPILLLDEPTRSLDPLAAQDMRELILSFNDVSILLTSHNLSEIEELCSRVAVISRGEIRAIDTPPNLRRQTKQTQQVTIIFSGNSENISHKNLFPKLQNFTIENFNEIVSVNFEREPEDELLGEIISMLTANGAKIINVETENPTLLDVLESYE
jgi:ABC-2 type transport system ATP-binding protein